MHPYLFSYNFWGWWTGVWPPVAPPPTTPVVISQKSLVNVHWSVLRGISVPGEKSAVTSSRIGPDGTVNKNTGPEMWVHVSVNSLSDKSPPLKNGLTPLYTSHPAVPHPTFSHQTFTFHMDAFSGSDGPDPLPLPHTHLRPAPSLARCVCHWFGRHLCFYKDTDRNFHCVQFIRRRLCRGLGAYDYKDSLL